MRLIVVLICLCQVVKANIASSYDSIVKSNYRDFDYFRLEGIDEIKTDEPSNYPYFNITSVNREKKIITYVYSDSERTEQVFEKRNNYWISITELSTQREHTFFYTFLYEDRAITFVYFYDLKYPKKNGESYIPDDLDLRERKDYTLKDHYLTQVRIYTPLKTITYFFDFQKAKRKVWEEPSLELVEDVKKSNSFKSLVDERVVQGDVVIESHKSQLSSVSKNCYTLRDAYGYKHNIYYLQFFSQTVNCP